MPEASGPGASSTTAAARGSWAWVVAIPERDVVLAVACNVRGESAAQGRRFFEITESLLDALR
ncbi:MAG: hypothetical protein R3B99_35575 [Polyangiales bacterium]